MSSPERPPYLPELPERYVPVDFVPAPPAPDPEPASAPPQATAETSLPIDTAGVPEKQERVTLAGRVGAKPALRTTPRGVLVAKFPLGVKDEADGEQTTWHTILAFQKRAELVRDTVHQGDALEVIGYRNTRSYTGRDGKDHAVVEVHAAVIKQR